MSVRTHYKLIGAAGAAALALGALAGPALAAASTASASYTCNTQFGPAHPSAVYNMSSPPATLAVGQGVATTATITLDAGTTGLATAGLGWTSFNGTITTAPSATLAGLSLKVKKTTLGTGGAPGTTVAPATGSILAGTKLGTFTFTLGNLGSVALNGFDPAGTKLGSASFPSPGPTGNGRCFNDAAGGTPLLAAGNPVTVNVVKDTTKTAEKAKYSAKKNTATGIATVTSRFGTPATGKVTFTLKKGTHKVKSVKGTLNKKGVASVAFKHVAKKGKYSITGKYAGSATLTGSADKAKFTVK